MLKNNKLPSYYRFVREVDENKKTKKVLMVESTDDVSVLFKYQKEQAEYEALFEEQKAKEKILEQQKLFENKYSLINFLTIYNYNLLIGKVALATDVINKILSFKDNAARANYIVKILEKNEFEAIKEMLDLI